MEARCMRCKKAMPMKDIRIEQTARGGFMAKGVCEECGTKMCKIRSKADAEKDIESGAAKKAY